jgi:hypothetical protein
MTPNEIINQIVKRWEITDHFEEITSLKIVPQGAATGGEGMAMIAKFLKDLKNSNAEAYNEVEDLIVKLLSELAKKGRHIE